MLTAHASPDYPIDDNIPALTPSVIPRVVPSDLSRLEQLRASLRARMEQPSLRDEK